MLTTARRIVAGLEDELGVDLRPNQFVSVGQPVLEQASEPRSPSHPETVSSGTTDQIIHDHLAAGPLDWPRLAATIPAIEQERARGIGNDLTAQAIALAEAGATPEATVTVLRTAGLTDEAITTTLTVPVDDHLGESPTLYPRVEVRRALTEPMPIKPLADELVADLLVSAGRNASATRQLGTSPPPAASRRRSSTLSRNGSAGAEKSTRR